MKHRGIHAEIVQLIAETVPHCEQWLFMAGAATRYRCGQAPVHLYHLRMDEEFERRLVPIRCSYLRPRVRETRSRFPRAENWLSRSAGYVGPHLR